MQPLMSDHSEYAAVLRYRQIEYHRMPVMTYLSLEDPRRPTRDDFEHSYCYDRDLALGGD